MKSQGEAPPHLTVRGIQEKLKTERFGRTCYLFPSIDSTNRQAADFARRGVPEGTLVVAESQTHGKGRLGRSWFSPPFLNLTFSLVLTPPRSQKDAPRMALASCVALAEGIHETIGIQVCLKWPNDLLVREKKVSGLLLEYVQDPPGGDSLILGVGMNVNTPRDLWPREIADQTQSLREILGVVVDREKLLAVLLAHSEVWYRHFLDGDWDRISSRWKELSSTLGKKVRVVLENRQITGYARDIDSDGALLLESENGEEISVYSGDVVHLRDLNRQA